jgi:hypothetical protein
MVRIAPTMRVQRICKIHQKKRKSSKDENK